MKFKILHPWNLNPKEAIKIQKNAVAHSHIYTVIKRKS